MLHFFLAIPFFCMRLRKGNFANIQIGGAMYTKLFSSILDSTIWMESTSTRIVWLTFLAAMNEDGYVSLPSIANVAHRARVSVSEASEAIKVLESPDPYSKNQDNDGRRIESVPGGFIVLNAKKYREISRRYEEKEQTKQRVAAYKKRKTLETVYKGNGEVTVGNALVTLGNAPVTVGNGEVTQNTIYTEAEAYNKNMSSTARSKPVDNFEQTVDKYESKQYNQHINQDVKEAFEYWKQQLKHPKAKLDKKRQRLIDWAVKAYGLDEVKASIRGLKLSSYHMGENKDRTVYDDISLVCRDAKHLEMFASLDVIHKKKSNVLKCFVDGCNKPYVSRHDGINPVCADHFYHSSNNSNAPHIDRNSTGLKVIPKGTPDIGFEKISQHG